MTEDPGDQCGDFGAHLVRLELVDRLVWATAVPSATSQAASVPSVISIPSLGMRMTIAITVFEVPEPTRPTLPSARPE